MSNLSNALNALTDELRRHRDRSGYQNNESADSGADAFESEHQYHEEAYDCSQDDCEDDNCENDYESDDHPDDDDSDCVE